MGDELAALAHRRVHRRLCGGALPASASPFLCEWDLNMASTTMTVNIDSALLPRLKALLAEYEREQAPPPTFHVGQWVTFDGTPEKTAKVIDTTEWGNGFVNLSSGRDTWTYIDPKFIRLATQEEIAAATLIVPKDGMLLREKANGRVSLVLPANDQPIAEGFHWLQVLPPSTAYRWQVSGLYITTELYDILDSYTVQGVR